MKLKTNMHMNVAIGGMDVAVEHKTGVVDVNDLARVGNMIRASKGRTPITIPRIRSNKGIAEFAEAVQRQVDEGHYGYFDVPAELVYATAKSGANARTKAFLPVALKIAAYMDVDFEAEVYRVFIEERILQYRDEGGHEFKTLNIVIDSFLPGREDTASNKGVYISVAKQLRDKVFPEHTDWNNKDDGNIWNSPHATPERMRLRHEYEAYLSRIMKDGLIRDYEHLREVIAKL